MRHEIPYLAVVVSYNLQPIVQLPTENKDGKRIEGDESWKELLEPEDMPIFNALRD